MSTTCPAKLISAKNLFVPEHLNGSKVTYDGHDFCVINSTSVTSKIDPSNISLLLHSISMDQLKSYLREGYLALDKQEERYILNIRRRQPLNCNVLIDGATITKIAKIILLISSIIYMSRHSSKVADTLDPSRIKKVNLTISFVSNFILHFLCNEKKSIIETAADGASFGAKNYCLFKFAGLSIPSAEQTLIASIGGMFGAISGSMISPNAAPQTP